MAKMNKNGFTIVELLIAISVFSSLLIIIVYAFLYGLNTFTKAQIVSNTQETARSIEQNLTQSFSLTASGSYTQIQSNHNGSVLGFCLGQYRYSYVLDTKLSGNNLGLIQDTYNGCNSSTKAVDLYNLPDTLINSKQLLGNNMRISQFSINQLLSSSGYEIKMEIDYGDNPPLVEDRVVSNGSKYYCPSVNIAGSFCAVAKIDTIVFQRIQ